MKKIYILLFAILPSISFAQHVENPSFEDWEVEGGKQEPVNWSSVQTGLPNNISALAPQVMTQSTDAHTGQYSVKLECISTFGIVATGIITNGRIFADFDPTKGYANTVGSDSRWNTPILAQPDSIVGWYKFAPSGSDVTEVKAVIHTGDAKIPDATKSNFLGEATFTIPNTLVATWTRFSVPFVYTSSAAPDHVLIVLSAGNGTQAVKGSIAYYDDIELIYNPLGLAELNDETASIFGYGKHINIDLKRVQVTQEITLHIYDVLGREVKVQNMQPGTMNVISDLPTGFYVCTLQSGNQVTTKKVVVQ
jgi:hypothetical protein